MNKIKTTTPEPTSKYTLRVFYDKALIGRYALQSTNYPDQDFVSLLHRPNTTYEIIDPNGKLTPPVFYNIDQDGEFWLYLSKDDQQPILHIKHDPLDEAIQIVTQGPDEHYYAYASPYSDTAIAENARTAYQIGGPALDNYWWHESGDTSLPVSWLLAGASAIGVGAMAIQPSSGPNEDSAPAPAPAPAPSSTASSRLDPAPLIRLDEHAPIAQDEQDSDALIPLLIHITVLGSGVAGDTLKITIDDGEGVHDHIETINHDWDAGTEMVFEVPVSLYSGAEHIDLNATHYHLLRPASQVSQVLELFPPPYAPVLDDDVGPKLGSIAHGESTNDTHPSIMVTQRPAGAHAQLFVDAKPVESYFDAETGQLSPVEPLPDGDHHLSYRLVDDNGRHSPLSLQKMIYVDTHPPEAPSMPEIEAASTDTSVLTLQIVEPEPGFHAELIIDGEVVEAIYNPDSSTLTSVEPVPDGPQLMAYQLVDLAGNISPASPALTRTQILEQPNSVDNQGAVTGTVNVGAATDDRRPELHVSPPPEGTVLQLLVDGQHVEAQYNPETELLSPSMDLSSGKHYLAYQWVDSNGHISAISSAVPLVIQVQAPQQGPDITVAIDDIGVFQAPLTDGQSTDDNQPGLPVGLLPIDTQAQLLVDGVLVQSHYNPITGVLSPADPLSDGQHTLAIQLQDHAGNLGAPGAALTLNIDTQPPAQPAPPVLVDLNGQGIAAQTPVSLNRPALEIAPPGEGETPSLHLNGTPINATYDASRGLLIPDQALADGNYSLSYTLVDSAGNSSVLSAAAQIIIDTKAPDGPLHAGPVLDTQLPHTGEVARDTPTNDQRPALTIIPPPTATHPTLLVDGVEVAADYDPVAHTLTPQLALTDGAHTLAYFLHDSAGNASSASAELTVLIDTQAPETPEPPTRVANTQAAHDDVNPLVIQVSAGADSVHALLLINGQEVPTTYDPQAGTLTADHALPVQDHQVAYALVDSAGNQSAPSPSSIMSIAAENPELLPQAQIVDDLGSIQGVLEEGDSSDDTRPTLLIPEIPPDVEVQLLVNGNVVASQLDGQSLTPQAALPEGQLRLSYAFIDANGQRINSSPQTTLTLITQPPDTPLPPINFFDQHGSQTGPVAAGAHTDDTRPALHLDSIAPATTPTLLVDGQPVAAVYDAYARTLTPVEPLSDGPHSIGYLVVDKAGNASPESAVLSIIIDSQAPSAPVAAGELVNDAGVVQIQENSADNTPSLKIPKPMGGETPVLLIEGQPVTAQYDPQTQTLHAQEALPDGPYQLQYAFLDVAGNLSQASPSTPVYIDTQAADAPGLPEVLDDVGNLRGPVTDGSQIDDAKPTLVIETPPAGEQPQLWVNGVLVDANYDPETGHLTPAEPLEDDTHTLYYTWIDSAGNRSAASPSLTLTVDTQAPQIDQPPSAYAHNAMLEPNSETSDAHSGLLIAPPSQGSAPILLVDGLEAASYYDPQTNVLRPQQALPEGGHQLSYQLVDAADNHSAPSAAMNIIVDTQAPDAPSSATQLVDEQGQVITEDLSTNTNIGLAIPPHEYPLEPVLLVNGQVVAANYNAHTGVLMPESLEMGLQSLSYAWEDLAGNQSAASPATDITIQSEAPPPAALENGQSITSDRTPSLLIQTPPDGSTVALLVDGQTVAATYDAEHNTLTPQTPLPEGLHELSYQLIDESGNRSAVSAIQPVTIDSQAPVAATNTTLIDHTGHEQGPLVDGAKTDETRPVLQIDAPTSGERPELLVDGQVVAATYNPDTQTLKPDTPLTDGAHTISYQLVDRADNRSAESNKHNIVIDSQAPEISQSTSQLIPDTNNGNTNETRPALQIDAPEAGEQAELLVDGEVVAATYDPDTQTLTPDAPLTDGAHEISHQLVDNAGNRSPAPNAHSVVVDTQAPEAPQPNSQLIDNTGSSQGAIASGAATDEARPALQIDAPEAGEQVELLVDGEVVSATYDPDTQTLTPDAPLTDGAHEISHQLVDNAGNRSPASNAHNVVVDTQAPEAPQPTSQLIDNTGSSQGTLDNGAVTDEAQPALQIDAPEPVEQAELLVDGEVVAATYDPDTQTLTPDAPLTDGAHEISHQLVDSAGNRSPASSAHNVVVDTQAPEAPQPNSQLIDNTGSSQGAIASGAATDDSQPALQIDAPEAGEQAELLVDGEVVAATYDPDTQTLTPDAPLTDGAHEISHQLVDSAGNRSPASSAHNVVVDTQAPEAPQPNSQLIDNTGSSQGTLDNGTATDETQPTLQIDAPEPDEQAELLVDGEVVAATYDPDTQTLTPDVPLTDGAHEISHQLVDNAGNRSPASNAHNVVVDTQAPEAPQPNSQLIDNTGSSQGAIAPGTVTDEAQPALQIDAPEADEQAELLVDGEVVSATYDPDTQTLTPDAPLTDGAHEISHQLVDSAGNRSPTSNAHNVVVDTQAPEAPQPNSQLIDNTGSSQGAIAPGTVTDEAQPALQIDAPEPGEQAELLVDGEVVAATYDPDTQTLTPDAPLTDGAHEISHQLVDSAGNRSPAPNAHSVVVDTQAPEAPQPNSQLIDNTGSSQGTLDNGAATDETRPALQIDAPEPGEQAELLVDGEVVAATYDPDTQTLTPDAPLTDGAHEISHQLVDSAGNRSPASSAHNVVVDTQAPEAPQPNSQLIDNTGSSQGAIASGAATDEARPALQIDAPEAGEQAELLVDGTVVAATYDPDTQTLTPDAPLTDGAHEISHQLVDSAGNRSPAPNAHSVVVDTQAPEAPQPNSQLIDNTGSSQGTLDNGAATDETRPALQIDAPEPGEQAELLVDGEVVAATYDPDTQTLTPDAPLTDGAHEISHQLVDNAGNRSPASNAHNVVVDTQAPEAPQPNSQLIDNTGSSQGAIASGAATDETQPALQIDAPEAGEQAELLVDGEVVAATYDPDTQTLTPDVPLTDGAHEISHQLVDSAGNRSPTSNAHNVVVDTQAPEAPQANSQLIDNTGSSQGAIAPGTVTDEAQPALQIDAPEPGEQAELLVDGEVVSATYDPDTQTLTPDAPLTDGSHEISHQLVDSAGNRSPASNAHSVVVDTQAPEAPQPNSQLIDNTGSSQGAIAPGAATDETRPALQIDAPEPGEQAELLVDGEVVAATYDPDTQTLTPDAPLTDGAHEISHQLVDSAGNRSPVSNNAHNLVVDTQAPDTPQASTQYTDDKGPVQGVFDTNTTTDDNQPALNIPTPQANLTPILLVNGQVAAATYDAGTGRLTPENILADGHYSLAYALQDQAGNTSASSDSIEIDIDTQQYAPVVNDVTLAPGYEDTVLTFNDSDLLSAASDQNSDPLSVTSVNTPPPGATLTDLGDGRYALTADEHLNIDQTSLTFSVSDGTSEVDAEAIYSFAAVADAPLLSTEPYNVEAVKSSSNQLLLDHYMLALSDGRSVVVDNYQDENGHRNIHAQFLDQAGLPDGAALVLAQDLNDAHIDHLRASSDGGFVAHITDNSLHSEPGNSSHYIVYNQSGTEISRTTDITSDSSYFVNDANSAESEAGQRATIWTIQRGGIDGDDRGDDLALSPSDAHQAINISGWNGAAGGNIMALDNDRFVISWAEPDTQGNKIYIRFVEADDSLSDTQQINTSAVVYTENMHTELLNLDTNQFITAWLGTDGIYIQNIDYSGTKLGDPKIISADDPLTFSLTPTEDGDYIVAWVDRDDRGETVYASRFNSDGTQIAHSEISPTVQSGVSGVEVIENDDLSISITWQADSATGPDIYVKSVSEQLDDTLIRLTQGESGQLPIAQLLLQDTDGSEQLSIVLNGLPDQSILSDSSGHSATVTDGAVDVSDWDVANISLQLPDAQSENFTIELAAVATESSNADAVTVNDQISVHIHPAPLAGDALFGDSPPLILPQLAVEDPNLLFADDEFLDSSFDLGAQLPHSLLADEGQIFADQSSSMILPSIVEPDPIPIFDPSLQAWP